MPSRRAAAIVLGAAVVVGATAGVSAAIANVEVPGLLAAGPSRTPDASEPPKASPKASPSVPAPAVRPSTASPPPSTSPEPDPTVPGVPGSSKEPEAEPVAPTEYLEVDFSRPGTGPNGEGGSTSRAEVPKGWSVEDKGVQWQDFRDPTGNLNLRVRGDGETWSGSLERAIRAKDERRKAKGYRELGWKEIAFDVDGLPGTGIEYRFSYTGSKGTRYGVERYFLEGNAMVGGYAWEGQLDLVEAAVVRASKTYVGGGD